MNESPDQDLLDYDEEEASGGIGAWFGHQLRTWGPAFLILLVVWSTVIQPFRIPSGSMVPTLEIGDHILVAKFAYGLHVPWIDFEKGNFLKLPIGTRELVSWGEPERGDVIVFKYPPDPKMDYIKRVVGVPGDTIQVQQNRVILNDALIERAPEGAHPFVDDACRVQELKRYSESLTDAPHAILNSERMYMPDFGPVTVPDDHYFVMGDNRDNSADSRVWGFVPRENVVGNAFLIWLSWNTCEGEIGPFGSFREGRAGTVLE